MQIAVIGAGLVGISTALELSKDGHEVSVFERGASIATEGSFAPHGAIVPGLLQAHPAWGLRLFGPQPSMNPAHWAGQLTRWRADRSERAAARRSVACDLARLGLQQLTTATDVEQLELEGSRGAMMMIRRPSDCARAQALADTLVATGERVELRSADGARLVEPALNGDTALAGALHWPHAVSANCRQLAQALKSASQRMGARYFLQHVVRALNPGARPGVLVMPASGGSVPGAVPQEFDVVVVCAAADSAALLRPLGIRLPWQAVHSCSVTAPLRDSDDADRHLPRGILLDPDRHVIVSRLGQRVRVAGRARPGPPRQTPSSSDVAPLYAALDAWFPGAARQARAQAWAGAQPAFADALPALGPSGVPGIWLNLGHGAHGAAWAGATARLLAERLAGREPSLDMTSLDPQRLR